MDAHEKAIETRINEIHDAIIDGVECPQQGCAGGDSSYCRNSILANKAECPYISDKTVSACIDMPSQERRDFILKKTDVKPTGPRESVPSHMEDKFVCEYTLPE